MNIANHKLCSHFVRDPSHDIRLPIIIPFQFNQEEVFDLLSNVRSNASTGSDGIPSFMWSKLSSFIAEPLTMIYNECLRAADLPSLWKFADIILFPKTSVPNLDRVRPISLLPIPESLLEKEILKRLGNDIFPEVDKNQYGYRKRSSTVCALLNIEEFVTSNLQKSSVQACHLLSVDLTRGFDKLSHRLLLQKMLCDKLNPYFVAFFNNYLQSRLQRIRWKQFRSDPLPVLSGVPQGSSFAPLLFSYFTSDLSCNNCVDSDSLSLTKYADDILIAGVTSIYKNTDVSPVLPAYMELSEWTESNKMEVKDEKCIQTFVRLSDVNDFSHLQISNIPTSQNLKFLGVIINKDFKWFKHVSSVSKRASSKLSVLRQLKPFISSDDLILIYRNCIRSILEYAAPLLVNLMTKEKDALERIQSRAHRIICGSSRCECENFVPLDYRRCIIGLRLFHQLANDYLHPLHHLCPDRNPTSRTFRPPVIKASVREKSFIVTMIRLANNGII